MITKERMSIREIEQLAESKLVKWGIHSIPVNPVLIANGEGVDIYDVNFQNQDVSGLISKEKGRVVIYIKHSDIPARKRFTLAHELGHLFLHLSKAEEGNRVDILKYRIDGKPSMINPQEEIEANQFAAALLMPREHVERESRSYTSVEDLALAFGVSVQAMTIRLRSLDKANG